MAKTHYQNLEAKIRILTSAPAEPVDGDTYYDSATNRLYIYNADNAAWEYVGFTTTTSTSTSTTSTSTSTTSTSSSTTSSTSTSITTSTSTTTTL